jgi:nucleotide-binding universal stress UspA family protein
VLVPLDGSPLAETVLAPARALALALAAPGPADVHLTLVVAPYKAERTNMPDALILDGAKAYLEGVSQHLLADGGDGRLTVTRSVAVNYDFAHGILEAAEGGEHVAASAASGAGTSAAGGCDVIAMATHGRGGVARWALGSVTERVLHATRLPILIVRPKEMAARGYT